MMQGLMGWIEKILSILGMNKQEDVPVYQTSREPRRKQGKGKVAREERRKAMTEVLQPAYTRRLRPDPEEGVFPATEPRPVCIAPKSLLTWHGLTDTGMVRPHNEDNFSCLDFEKGSLFVVADGMGGHDAGEVASKIAVDTVCREARQGVKLNKAPLDLVEHVVHQANTAVRQEGAARGSNMGTTLSVAFVADNIAYIANVGDSRVYWAENGSIRQITEDHTLVARLVAAGKLTKEEARNHPKSNLLYRTVGTDDAIKVDTFQVGLKKGGNLLLCTDGLWGMVADKDMHNVCAQENNMKKACSRLVKMANDNGGVDNITAVMVRVA